MTFVGFWKWGFRSSVKIHTGDESQSPKINDSLTFHSFVEKKLPALDPTKKLWLNPWLFNGALQTLYYGTHNSASEFKVFYGREIFTYADKGVCSLDWKIKPEDEQTFKQLYNDTLPSSSPRLHPHTRFFTSEELEQMTKPNQAELTNPICVVIHGLAGGSHEPLIRNLAQDLDKMTSTDWDFVVINSRGCCRTKITTGKLFNALSHSDIEEVLVDLKKRFPNRPIYAVGFSFGAVTLANCLAFEGEKAKKLVEAAALIGCPWDMVDSATHLQNSLSGRYLFSPNLTAFLNKLIKSNLQELKLHSPDLFTDENIKLAKAAKATSEWDDVLTCKTAGFANSHDYYVAGSPAQRINDIKVPTLTLNSTDDPTVSGKIPFDAVHTNPNLAMVETNLGGHLGWVKYSGEFWCVEVACNFIDSLYTATLA